MCDYRTMEFVESWGEIGAHIREARLAARLSQQRLAELIGMERSMLTKVESGDRRVDVLELHRLATVLDLPLGHFLSRPLTVLSRRAELRTVPADEMEPQSTSDAYRIEALLGEWCREVQLLVEIGALTPARQLAYPGRVDTIDAAATAALWLRDQLGAGRDPIASMSGFAERAGQYVLVRDIPGDGASVIDGDVAVAIVGLRGEAGRRRATAAHELGHLILGDEYSNDVAVNASRAEREGMVDAFAAELLLPRHVVVKVCERLGDAELRARLIALSATFRTSWSLALRQACRGEVIDQRQREKLAAAVPTRADFMAAIGWTPQPDLESVRVPPGYAQAVVAAVRAERITPVRAVELMHGELTLEDLGETTPEVGHQ
ncbi:MAG: helix-turn-helix domain-containing protein [Streptosporangiales bacterium]|nr:helix-turn-helix domain-containing protein [Streptosporangiales bacterium]